MDPRVGASPCPTIPEKLVARLWEEQRPFALPLVTTSGEEIQVVYRGRRRWDRGPDFAGALIAWGNAKLSSGDVEVHVRSTDWWAHGHHRDRYYNGVILQVVMWDDATGPTVREDGVRVPVVALATHLSAPLETLLSPSPVDTPVLSPCWRGDLEYGGPLGELLERCGRERFATKAARFESDLTCVSPDQLLYQGIAVALGFSQNRKPFHRLAERLPLEVLRAYRAHSQPSTVEALLMGAAGLLPSQRGLSAEEGYARALEERWSLEGLLWAGNPIKASEWEFFRVRPANFPTRRLAALAALVDRWPTEGLAETLASLVRASEPRALPKALEALLLRVDPGSYWRYHCDFGLPLRRPANLIGRQRAAEIAVNVFLPFLAAWASHRGDAPVADRVREVYRLYPKRGDNEIARYVAALITGLPRPRVARSACRQQGLLHLYWTHCERKRCGECPCVLS